MKCPCIPQTTLPFTKSDKKITSKEPFRGFYNKQWKSGFRFLRSIIQTRISPGQMSERSLETSVETDGMTQRMYLRGQKVSHSVHSRLFLCTRAYTPSEDQLHKMLLMEALWKKILILIYVS